MRGAGHRSRRRSEPRVLKGHFQAEPERSLVNAISSRVGNAGYCHKRAILDVVETVAGKSGARIRMMRRILYVKHFRPERKIKPFPESKFLFHAGVSVDQPGAPQGILAAIPERGTGRRREAGRIRGNGARNAPCPPRVRGIRAVIDYPAMGPRSLLVLAACTAAPLLAQVAPPLQREGSVLGGAL